MLTNMLLRVATVKALRGRTIAGDRVFNSAIDPLQLLDKTPQPVIVVYTEEDRASYHGRSMLTGSRQVTLAIHLVVGSRIATQDHGVLLQLADTDAGLEAQLDTLRYQIACLFDVVDSPWMELWHDLVTDYVGEETRRGADNDGVKFAAREILLKVGTIGNMPPRLGPLDEDGLWAKAIALFRADPDLAHTGDWMAAVLEAGEPATERQTMASRLGLAPAVVDYLGLGHLVSGPVTIGDLSGSPVETMSEPFSPDETIDERLEPTPDE